MQQGLIPNKKKLEDLYRMIQNMTVYGGRVSISPEAINIVIDFPDQTVAGSSIRIAKTNGVMSTVGSYVSTTADIYSNLDKDPIAEDVTLVFIQLVGTVPADILLHCWQQEFGTAGNEVTYWTTDIARAYGTPGD